MKFLFSKQNKNVKLESGRKQTLSEENKWYRVYGMQRRHQRKQQGLTS
jgi:hypothetical protein